MSDFCWWSECANEPSHRIRGLVVKPRGSERELDLGDVYLCPVHYQFALRIGRVNIEPKLILAATEQQTPE